MKHVVASFADSLGKTKDELSGVLDQEVEKFSSYMDKISDWKAKGPLSPPERALIKSYLVAKLSGKLDGE